MAAKQIIAKHYQRIITSWPKDLLRPEVSFQKALHHRMDTRLTPSTTATSDNIVANEAQATVPAPRPFDEKGELEQVNVLYSFLENRYTKRYPLSERMLQPLSNPSHYKDLVKELEEAPTRSWLGSKLNKWKGFLRLS